MPGAHRQCEVPLLKEFLVQLQERVSDRSPRPRGQGHSKASARGTRAASTPRPALPPLQAAVCLSADGPSPGHRAEASTRAQPPVHPPSASEHRILFFFFPDII